MTKISRMLNQNKPAWIAPECSQAQDSFGFQGGIYP